MSRRPPSLTVLPWGPAEGSPVSKSAILGPTGLSLSAHHGGLALAALKVEGSLGGAGDVDVRLTADDVTSLKAAVELMTSRPPPPLPPPAGGGEGAEGEVEGTFEDAPSEEAVEEAKPSMRVEAQVVIAGIQAVLALDVSSDRRTFDEEYVRSGRRCVMLALFTPDANIAGPRASLGGGGVGAVGGGGAAGAGGGWDDFRPGSGETMRLRSSPRYRRQSGGSG
jgi:hypothetical protein